MGLYQAICPCCGRLNRNLYLEETEGFFECEACGQIANARDFMTDTSSGDEIKKLKKAMDIYAKVKYNKPEEVVKALEGAFAMWEGQSGTK